MSTAQLEDRFTARTKIVAMALRSPRSSPTLISIIVVFIAHIQLSKPETSAQYLHGGPRLGNDSFIDYYFCCNINGSSLQVFVNGLSAGGFTSSESGTVRSGSHSNFSYFTALVSVSDILQGNYRYDAIITVSVDAAIPVEVRCRSRLGSASANNGGGTVNQNNIFEDRSAADISGQLVIQQLFSSQVVQGPEMTHGFICGVQRDFQTWRIENDSNYFLFDDYNRIGDTRTLPDSPSTVNNLAFLFAQEPFQIVTIMLLTGGNINSRVMCSAGRYNASLSIADMTKPRTTITTTLSAITTDLNFDGTSTQQMSSPLNETQEDFPTTIVSGVVAGVLAAFGVAVFTVIIVLLIRASAKRNKVKQNSHDRSDEVHVDEVKLSRGKEHEVELSL